MNGIRGWKKRRASWKNYFSYYSISQNLRKLIHNDHLIGIHPNNTRKQWKENQIKWSKAVMMPLILLMCVCVCLCVCAQYNNSSTARAQTNMCSRAYGRVVTPVIGIFTSSEHFSHLFIFFARKTPFFLSLTVGDV